jgi:hypothetical protein
MEKRDDIDFLLINHRNMIKDPENEVQKIIDFLGIDQNLKNQMLDAIDKRSYRNKR